jgi:hypothetical protein
MIHIIRSGPGDTSILSRKARILVKELGWSISSHPDPGARLNYALPYLDGRNDLKGLPFAAYFTHREDCIAAKVAIWEERARKAILRITSAQQYYEDLASYGATAKITPPLDREKFQPIKTRKSPGNKVGVAGFVYQGGRKGETLLKEAIAKTGGEFDYQAAGKGWPIPAKLLPYDRLQEFYQGIDILLCTALIEGIPYPPLEALACGKKIVIPAGVGLLDELPDIPGIERYEAGNVNKMIEALTRARETKADPEELREATARFTDEAWAEGHAKAFAEIEDMVQQTGKARRRNKRQDRGIYVVAYGAAARRCARALIRSINQFMPETQVAVASDKPLPEADVHVNHESPGVGARNTKLAAYELAPQEWKQVIYLDADTELTESIEHLFYCLEAGWEMVFTKDINSRDTVPYLKRNKDAADYNETRELVGADDEIALAGGVWAFRRGPGSKRYLATWQAEWGSGKYRDQPSMLRAYYKTKVRAIVLGSEWNSFTNNRHENRAEIIRHHSGGTARTRTRTPREFELTVVNTSPKPIERAGLLFMPNSPVLIDATSDRFKEIKACEFLEIIN